MHARFLESLGPRFTSDSSYFIDKFFAFVGACQVGREIRKKD